jgi:hypothetical protein
MQSFTQRIADSVDYRLKALLSRYYYGNRDGLPRWIRQRRFRRSMEILPRREPELDQLLRQGLAIFEMNPNRPNSRYSDALFLFDAIMKHRPTKVLECGSGLSTLIIAFALERLERDSGHKASFVSIDESAEYLDQRVRRILPPHLAPRVQLVASPIGYWKFENGLNGRIRAGIGYTALPRQDFDFIYVDGPQVRQGHYDGLNRIAEARGGVPEFLRHKPFDCDAINVLLNSERSATIVIDQRIDTRWQMKYILDRPYRSAYCFAPRKSVFIVPPSAVQSIRSNRLDADLGA